MQFLPAVKGYLLVLEIFLSPELLRHVVESGYLW